MDIFTKTCYFPTFTNHLVEKFGLSIEGSSIFFVINIISYFVVLNFLNWITSKYGLKLTLVSGLFLLFVGILFLPPIPLLPQSVYTVIFGLLILGIPAATINVPAICDLIETLKNGKLKLDDNSANDMASAIYNLGLNFGESLGPTFGGYVAKKSDFQTSCIYVSLINLSYCIFFFMINYGLIQRQLEDAKKASQMTQVTTQISQVTEISKVIVNDKERKVEMKRQLMDDYSEYYVPTVKIPQIDLDRQYASRFRSFSYSKRSSKRSSINTINANFK